MKNLVRSLLESVGLATPEKYNNPVYVRQRQPLLELPSSVNVLVYPELQVEYVYPWKKVIDNRTPWQQLVGGPYPEPPEVDLGPRIAGRHTMTSMYLEDPDGLLMLGKKYKSLQSGGLDMQGILVYSLSHQNPLKPDEEWPHVVAGCWVDVGHKIIKPNALEGA